MPGTCDGSLKANTEPSRDKFVSGVCNEHVQPAEAKMCSELYRNVERLAEMTNPAK